MNTYLNLSFFPIQKFSLCFNYLTPKKVAQKNILEKVAHIKIA